MAQAAQAAQADHDASGDAATALTQLHGFAAEGSDQAWNRDVSEDNKRSAVLLFRQGTELVKASELALAVEKYEEALSHWPHPGIYANLARVVMAQEEHLKAYEYAVAALRYGKAPLGIDAQTRDTQYDELRRIKDQLRVYLQLVELRIDSDEPGVGVFIGGQTEPIELGAGQVVLAGRHLIGVEKPGYQPLSQSLHFYSGTSVRYRVSGYRRMEQWKPWALVGGGVALGLIGGGVYWDTWRRHRDLQTQSTARCDSTNGTCEQGSANDADTWRRIQWQERGALVTLTVSGLLVSGGTALVWWNRHRHFRIQSIERAISVTPVVSPQTAGVSASMSF